MAEATKPKYYLGTGRRKTSVARVRLAEGSGQISINGRELNDYFTEDKDRAAEEISQLLYHAQVLMLARGIELDDVYAHL